MALDRRERCVADVRRLVAFRAFGALRLLSQIQGALQDVEGAACQGQLGVAAVQARSVVLACLSIRSLERAGEIDDDQNSLSFDFFAGLPPDEVAAALALANEAIGIDALSTAAWLERLRAYVEETQRLLGYPDPLPVLRSAEGGPRMIGIVSRWSRIMEEMGLPPLLLSEISSGGSFMESPKVKA